MKKGVLRAMHVHFSFAVHSAAFLVLIWLVEREKKNDTRAARAAHTSGTKQQLIIGVPQLRFWQQLEQAKVTFFLNWFIYSYCLVQTSPRNHDNKTVWR